jgi:hypothetical protein
MLPVTMMTLVILAPLEFDDLDFLRAALCRDFRGDFAASHEWSTERYIRTDSNEQNLIKFNGVTNLGVEFLDPQTIALGCAILLAAGSENCIH